MKNISRRKFIGNSVKGATIVSAGAMSSCSVFSGNQQEGKMPTRVLGKTGLDVSVLSFGGGSQFQKNKNGDWERLLEEAVKSGIHIFDTAPNYSQFNLSANDLGSDERFGQILPKYRDKVLICTKLDTRDPKKVKEEIEGSLSRLKTDYVDILQLHGIHDKDNVDEIEKGVYKEMQKLKKSGIARFIGFSSMSSAARSQEMLEKLDVDVALLAFNPTMYGNYWDTALPAARKQNTGVMAMKVMRNLVGEEATSEELFSYGLSLEGVSTLLVGHIGTKTLKENVVIAQKFGNNELAKVDHRELEYRLAKHAGPHKLCWARPDYTDGMTLV